MNSTTLAPIRRVSRARVIGTSDAIRRVERDALLAARLNANVLITGERGVGKTVVARFIHEHSDRSLLGFASIDCDGLPDRLFESLLFGHVQGSFAGAYRDKPALLDSVAGGTVLLAEVGALSLKMQAVLLRFLKSGEYQPIGGQSRQVRRAVRLITSTTTDLAERVANGSFLDELYLRLNILHLAVPSLRERRDDIPSLVDHFSEEFAGLRRQVHAGAPEVSASLLDSLCQAEWRGNVRELKDAVLTQLLGGGR